MSFKNIGEILKSAASKRPGWEKQFGRSIIWRKWEALVGPAISKNALPDHIDQQDCLIVKAADSIWMERLFMERVHLLNIINKSLPEDMKLKSIRFIMADGPWPGQDQRAKTSTTGANRGPNIHFSPSQLKEAEEITQNVRDKILRKRLIKAYLAYKAKKMRLDDDS